MTDTLEILFVINVNNMVILRNNVMDIIKLLNKSVNVHQKEIDQVKKKTELKSTNPLKVNKRKRKQKDIIMKLIGNLPNHLKNKNAIY